MPKRPLNITFTASGGANTASPAFADMTRPWLELLAEARRAELLKQTPFAPREAAGRLDRLASNLARDWKKLQEMGLAISDGDDLAPYAALSDRGRAFVRLFEHERVAVDGVALNRIDPDPDQPRTVFDRDELGALAASIDRHGLLQPVLLRRHRDPARRADGVFVLVDGERRLRALQMMAGAGLLPDDWPVPAILQGQSSNASALTLAQLAANIQRAQMNPMDEGRAFEALAVDKDTGEPAMTNAAIAEAIGRTPEYVQQRRKLLALSDLDQARMLAGQLTFTEARKLLTTPRAAAPNAPSSSPEPPAPPPADAPAAEPSSSYPVRDRSEGGPSTPQDAPPPAPAAAPASHAGRAEAPHGELPGQPPAPQGPQGRTSGKDHQARPSETAPAGDPLTLARERLDGARCIDAALHAALQDVITLTDRPEIGVGEEWRLWQELRTRLVTARKTLAEARACAEREAEQPKVGA